MSGDIEDFLKRAAERRQSRQATRPAAQPAKTPPASRNPARPEYTDSRRERTVPPHEDDDDLVVAEVVEQPLAKRIAELKQKQAEAQAAKQADRAGPIARREASAADKETRRKDPNRNRPASSVRNEPLGAARRAGASAGSSAQTPGSLTPSAAPVASADSGQALIDELLQSLKSPHGLQRAVLLHEILDRPVHRW